MMSECWVSVADAGPTFRHHWKRVLSENFFTERVAPAFSHHWRSLIWRFSSWCVLARYWSCLWYMSIFLQDGVVSAGLVFEDTHTYRCAVQGCAGMPDMSSDGWLAWSSSPHVSGSSGGVQGGGGSADSRRSGTRQSQGYPTPRNPG